MIGNAIRVAKIATGVAEEKYEDEAAKDRAAAELGRRAGKARAERMTAAERAEAAVGIARCLNASYKRSRRSAVLHLSRCCNSAQPRSVIPRVAEDEADGPHRTFVPHSGGASMITRDI